MNGVSRALLVAAVLLPALSSAQEASRPAKSGFDYNYAELSYDKHDFDVSREKDNIDGDGFTLSGSFKVADEWHVYASYVNRESRLRHRRRHLGARYRLQLLSEAEHGPLRARALHRSVGGRRSVQPHGEGLGLQFRIRARVNDKVEVEGGVQYLDVASSDT